MLYELFFKIIRKIKQILFYIIYKNFFKKYGKRTIIDSPDTLMGGRNIEIGDETVISKGAWLLALNIDNLEAKITIKNNVYIGRYSHIVSVRDVIIDDYALIADKVYISDNLHDYSDVSSPISQQPVIFKKEVKIGKGSWIGENVCIIGSSVGNNSVIAANSVVTKDIPAYSVAAGNPAKVIKKYNFELKKWVKV